jgi:PAS domain S-box-containing protein
MRLTIEKYAPLAFLIGLTLLVGISLVSYSSLNDLTRTADQVARTHELIGQLEEVLSDYKDALIASRGYALTGNESYLDIYKEAKREVDLDLLEVRRLTADNPRRGRQLDAIDQIKQQRYEAFEDIIKTRQTKGFDAALAMLKVDREQALVGEVRERLKDIEGEENSLLLLREAAALSSARHAKIVLVAGSSIGVLLTILAIMAVKSELDRRKAAEDALRQANIELERRVAERTAELSGVTRRLQFALDGARLGAWAVDLPHGRFWADEASREMLGFEPDYPISSVEESFSHIQLEDKADVIARFQEAIQNRAVFEQEYRVVMPNGAVRWVACCGQVAYSDSDDNQPLSMFAIIQDVTERKEAEAERERLLANEQAARRTAEEANRMKDEFLAVLSHELRTPLNAIIGYANLLRGGGNKPEEARRMLEIVLRNARTQQQLIGDMLDVSRIITGKMGLNIGPVEPEVIIQIALDTVRPAAEAKQITLDMTLDPSVGVITGDANRLQQAVWNLLSNAVKFTSPGGKVTVLLARIDSQFEITVSDTGKGINPEYLPHVFDRFSQEDYSITRRYGGLGLGLSIVRHIAELHGGSVRAMSEGEGRGTTFVIRLPLRKDHPVGTQKAGSHVGASSQAREVKWRLNGARVLVVDDDADTRQLLKRILETYGVVVRTAASAAEALEIIFAGPPDALVADIGMPDEDGYALMRKIRKLPSEHGRDVPALALTAFARPEDRARALTAGFQYYVAKPVEPDELAAVIASLTERLDNSTHD